MADFKQVELRQSKDALHDIMENGARLPAPERYKLILKETAKSDVNRGPNLSRAQLDELAERVAKIDSKARLIEGGDILTTDVRPDRATVFYDEPNGARLICG